MNTVEIRSDVDGVLAEQRQQIVQSPAVMATLMKRSSTRIKSRANKLLKVEPRDAPAGITAYMTPRQRRKVHALRNERGGGPYRRTHELRDAWDVKVTLSAEGGEIVATNSSPVAVFAYGERRQRFLEVIGWLDPVPTLAPLVQDAQEIVEANWYTATDPDAGVSR